MVLRKRFILSSDIERTEDQGYLCFLFRRIGSSCLLFNVIVPPEGLANLFTTFVSLWRVDPPTDGGGSRAARPRAPASSLIPFRFMGSGPQSLPRPHSVQLGIGSCGLSPCSGT